MSCTLSPMEIGDNLHDLLNLNFQEKQENIIYLLSAEFAHSMVCININLSGDKGLKTFNLKV